MPKSNSYELRYERKRIIGTCLPVAFFLSRLHLLVSCIRTCYYYYYYVAILPWLNKYNTNARAAIVSVLLQLKHTNTYACRMCNEARPVIIITKMSGGVDATREIRQDKTSRQSQPNGMEQCNKKYSKKMRMMTTKEIKLRCRNWIKCWIIIILIDDYLRWLFRFTRTLYDGANNTNRFKFKHRTQYSSVPKPMPVSVDSSDALENFRFEVHEVGDFLFCGFCHLQTDSKFIMPSPAMPSQIHLS